MAPKKAKASTSVTVQDPTLFGGRTVSVPSVPETELTQHWKCDKCETVNELDPKDDLKKEKICRGPKCSEDRIRRGIQMGVLPVAEPLSGGGGGGGGGAMDYNYEGFSLDPETKEDPEPERKAEKAKAPRDENHEEKETGPPAKKQKTSEESKDAALPSDESTAEDRIEADFKTVAESQGMQGRWWKQFRVNASDPSKSDIAMVVRPQKDDAKKEKYQLTARNKKHAEGLILRSPPFVLGPASDIGFLGNFIQTTTQKTKNPDYLSKDLEKSKYIYHCPIPSKSNRFKEFKEWFDELDLQGAVQFVKSDTDCAAQFKEYCENNKLCESDINAEKERRIAAKEKPMDANQLFMVKVKSWKRRWMQPTIHEPKGMTDDKRAENEELYGGTYSCFMQQYVFSKHQKVGTHRPRGPSKALMTHKKLWVDTGMGALLTGAGPVPQHYLNEIPYYDAAGNYIPWEFRCMIGPGYTASLDFYLGMVGKKAAGVGLPHLTLNVCGVRVIRQATGVVASSEGSIPALNGGEAMMLPDQMPQPVGLLEAPEKEGDKMVDVVQQ